MVFVQDVLLTRPSEGFCPRRPLNETLRGFLPKTSSERDPPRVFVQDVLLVMTEGINRNQLKIDPENHPKGHVSTKHPKSSTATMFDRGNQRFFRPMKSSGILGLIVMIVQDVLLTRPSEGFCPRRPLNETLRGFLSKTSS